MPTAAKAFSAIALALISYAISFYLIEPLFPEGRDLGHFSRVNAALGLIIGWRMIGGRVGIGIGPILGIGITTFAVLVITSALLHSTYLMVINSLRKRYDDPMEAMVDIIGIGLENLEIAMTVPVATTLGLGCILTALFAELVSRIAR